MSAFTKVQTKIFSVLTAGLTIPVYDSVPQDTTNFPYVNIGDDTFTDFDGDDFTGFDGTLTIHTWSTADGRIETKNLQGEIYDLLHRANLVILGYNVITIDQVFADSFLETDGITRHGVQRFRILLTKD